MNNSEVTVIDLIDEEREKTNQTLDTSNRMKLPSIRLPSVTESTKDKKKRIYLGVFRKFSYLKENSRNKEALIAYDYDNTTEEDFKELVSKCELKETNAHLEKSIDEYKNFSYKKFSSITKTIRHNSNELSRLIEKNSQLKQEILNLTKILELTIEKKSLCNNKKQIFIPKLQSSIFTEPSEDYSFKE